MSFPTSNSHSFRNLISLQLPKFYLLVFLLYSLCMNNASAQYTTLNAHSHNDYLQKQPFYLAYEHHFGSVEADIWTVDGDLLVAHDQKNISKEKTLDSLYLLPIVRLFKQNGGKAWKDQIGTFFLLIDVKDEFSVSLKLLADKLSKYPEVFNPALNPNAVKVVITGNRPQPENFKDFPSYLFFDGKLNLHYSPGQLERIALFSENLGLLCSWLAKTPMSEPDRLAVKKIIENIHQHHKPIRFWNAPDDPQAWQTLMDLQVDYINTDHIDELSGFFHDKR